MEILLHIKPSFFLSQCVKENFHIDELYNYEQ